MRLKRNASITLKEKLTLSIIRVINFSFQFLFLKVQKKESVSLIRVSENSRVIIMYFFKICFSLKFSLLHKFAQKAILKKFLNRRREENFRWKHVSLFKTQNKLHEMRHRLFKVFF